jgi:hypothetical protein
MIVTCLSLVLLTVQAEPQPKPELLPSAPKGWRFERIDFPLPFAPDLPHRGFEELRFAPGITNCLVLVPRLRLSMVRRLQDLRAAGAAHCLFVRELCKADPLLIQKELFWNWVRH